MLQSVIDPEYKLPVRRGNDEYGPGLPTGGAGTTQNLLNSLTKTILKSEWVTFIVYISAVLLSNRKDKLMINSRLYLSAIHQKECAALCLYSVPRVVRWLIQYQHS
jgi:hypothetical protein